MKVIVIGGGMAGLGAAYELLKRRHEVALYEASPEFGGQVRTFEVGGEGKRGIRVVSTSAPWSARVEWKEVEFDVELFKRTTERYLDPLEPGTGAPPDVEAADDEDSEPEADQLSEPETEQDQDDAAADDAGGDSTESGS